MKRRCSLTFRTAPEGADIKEELITAHLREGGQQLQQLKGQLCARKCPLEQAALRHQPRKGQEQRARGSRGLRGGQACQEVLGAAPNGEVMEDHRDACA